MRNKNLKKQTPFFYSEFYSPFHKEDFRKTFHRRISKIITEFLKGFHFISDLKKAIAFFGSSRFSSNNPYYQEAKKLAQMMVKEKFTIITGGGPGIMEAANQGAFEARGESIGFNIELPKKQVMNKFVTKPISFHYFFIRKVMFSFACSVYVFFPGGFGTINEFFEMVGLAQTKKIHQSFLIIVVGRKYWQSLFDWLEKEVYEKQKAIEKHDLKLFHLVDTAEQAFEIIKKNI